MRAIYEGKIGRDPGHGWMATCSFGFGFGFYIRSCTALGPWVIRHATTVSHSNCGRKRCQCKATIKSYDLIVKWRAFEERDCWPPRVHCPLLNIYKCDGHLPSFRELLSPKKFCFLHVHISSKIHSPTRSGDQMIDVATSHLSTQR